MQGKEESSDDRINYRDPNKGTLEALSGKLGHDSLSTTIREATSEYIAKRLHMLNARSA
jgi:hypothetical protein